MMYHRFALIALSVGLFCSVEGFSVGPVAFSRRTAAFPTSSTCLFVEETEAEEVQEETAAGDIVVPRAGGDDILNSPAFLQRKLDVIKSDIAKVEEQIAAAKAQLEDGKAEWGHQFEALEIEVSCDLLDFKLKWASFARFESLTCVCLFSFKTSKTDSANRGQRVMKMQS